MAKHSSITDLQIAAMGETLNAAQVLLADKNLSKSLFIQDGEIFNGCRYGYPAAILLFSFIDAVGTLYNIGKFKTSFRVLNNELFGNQNLDVKACDNLYDNYRSGLSHNLALPANHFLIYNPNNATAFITKQNPKKIELVNLHSLFILCKNALELITKEHTQVASESDMLKNLAFKGLIQSSQPTASDCPSGVCTYYSAKHLK